MNHIYKFGLIVIENNRMLLCRPFAYDDLIVPGGIQKEGESYAENLNRQVIEELGKDAHLNNDLTYLGNFNDRAAGKTERQVEIELYLGSVTGTLAPSTEIKELIWFSTSDDEAQLSPVIRNKILPFLIEKGYLHK